MSQNGTSELKLVLVGEDQSASETLAKIGKQMNDISSVAERASKAFADIGKVISESLTGASKEVSSASRRLTTLGTNSTKQADEVSKAAETIRKSLADIGTSALDKSMAESARAVRGDVAQIRDDMSSLVKTVEDTSKQAGKYGNRMGHMIDSGAMLMAGMQLQQVGQKIVGFLGQSVKAASEFSQSVANTRAALDAQPGAIAASNAEMKQMQQLALQIGTSGFYSANSISDAQGILARNGLKASTIMQGAIQQTANVAAANTADISSTATTLSDVYNELGSNIVKQFKGNVPDAFNYIGNVMTRVLHSSKISMDDLFSTMRYAGSAASNAGMSFADLGGAISLLGSHAIRGSQSGTTLRRMLINLTPQTAKATDMMKQLGLITANGSNIFYDATGQLKSMSDIQKILHDHIAKLSPQMQTLALKTIFGTYALNGMSIIANEAPASFEKLTASMNTAGATITALKDREKGWQYTWMRLQAEFKTIQKEIGLALKPAVDKLSTALQRLMNFWDHLSSHTQKVIIAITAAVGVLTLVGGTVLTLMASVGFLVQGLAAAGAAFTAMGGIALPIVGILAAVGVAAYELSKHWKTVKAVTEQVWSDVERIITNVISRIMTVIQPAINSVTSWWHSHFSEIQTVTRAVFDFIKTEAEITLIPVFIAIHAALGAFEAAWRAAFTVIHDVLKLAFDAAVTIVKTSWGIISGVLGVGLDVLTLHWHKAFTDLKNMVVNVFKDLTGGASKFTADFRQILVDAVKGIVNTVMGSFNGLVKGVETVWNHIKSIFAQKVSPNVQMPAVSVPTMSVGGVGAPTISGISSMSNGMVRVPYMSSSYTSSNSRVVNVGSINVNAGSNGNSIGQAVKTQIQRAIS